MDAVRATVAALIHALADRDAADRTGGRLRDLATQILCCVPSEECPLCGGSLCGSQDHDCALAPYNAHWADPLAVNYAGERAVAVVAAALRFLGEHDAQDMTAHELHLLARLVEGWAPGDLCALCGRPPGRCVPQTPTAAMCPLVWTKAPDTVTG